MEKRISESIKYSINLRGLNYVEDFIKKLPDMAKEYNKSELWADHVKCMIDCGLQIIFIHTNDIGEDEEKDMIFDAYIGYDIIGYNLEYMGTFNGINVDNLCRRYERESRILL